MISKKDKEEAKNFVLKAAKIAADRHCSDIVAMDLKGMSPATDFFLIATGTSARQTRSIAEEMMAEGKKCGFMPFGRAGLETGKWILIDFIDVVVHLFDAESREFYDLEMLWGDSERLELEGLYTNETGNGDN